MSYLFRIKRSIKNTVKELSLASAGFAAAGLGALYFDSHVGAIRAVEGPSMSPTLNPTEYTDEKFEDKSENQNAAIFLVEIFITLWARLSFLIPLRGYWHLWQFGSGGRQIKGKCTTAAIHSQKSLLIHHSS